MLLFIVLAFLILIGTPTNIDNNMFRVNNFVVRFQVMTILKDEMIQLRNRYIYQHYNFQFDEFSFLNFKS